MGKKLEIDEGRRVAVTPLGVPGGGRCIPGDDDFKTLSTSFCGSINTTAVSLLLMFMVTSFFWTVERVTTYPHAARSTECFCHWGAKDRGRSIPDAHRDGDPAANNTCALIP